MTDHEVAVSDPARCLLMYGDENSRDAVGLASTGSIVLQKLGGHLALLIGPTGYRAVLTRALQSAQMGSSWLAGIELPKQSEKEEELRGISQRLGGLDSVQAQAAIVTLLMGFLDVLTSMLGWEMSYRIVSAAWPEKGAESSRRFTPRT